ncbi:hypothetical protein G9A89_006656 [Geosiphon pyriformis]|nr:hypothetical protein G9A89_006656 [Geosiphon pyriformis]
MTSENLRPRIPQNWRSAMIVHQPIPSPSHQSSGLYSRNSGTNTTQNLNSQNYLSLLITPENATPNNQELKQLPTSNILPATITEDESLNTIFPFKLKEPSTTLLFSRAALEEKPITAIYTDVKIDGHFIKLILDSGSADSIITRQLMDQLGCQVDQAASVRIITADGVTKTPIGKIDGLPIEINGIIVPIKVLVMEATQYQVLVDDNDNGKRKHKEELTWETNDLTWTDNNESEPTANWEWEENKEDKGKGKKKEETTQTTAIYNSYIHPTPQQSNY